MKPLRPSTILTLALLVGPALIAVAQRSGGETPVVPTKAPPRASTLLAPGLAPQAVAGRAGLTGEPMPAETASTIQARLDAGETVPLSGAITLDRPLIIRSDGAGLVGFPRATLKTSGGFAAVLAGFPKPARYPGFAVAHRVDGMAPGMFAYRLAKDAYLSLRASQFEFGPARNWDEVQQLTVAFSVKRHTTSLQDGQDAVICTDPTAEKPDPISVTIQGRRVRVELRSDDDTEHNIDLMTPTVVADHFVVLALNTATGQLQGYDNGTAVETRVDRPWTPGQKVRWPRWSEFWVGRSPLSGPADLTVHGLKMTPRVVVPLDVPVGAPIRRTDGKTGSDGNPVGMASLLWDRHYSGEAILDMRSTSVNPQVPDLVAIRGGAEGEKRGFGMLLPAKWNPFDVIDRVEIKNLMIQTGDDFQGSALAWGACLNLRLSDLDLRGGLRGIDQFDPITSYPTLVERVRTFGQGDAGLVLGYGMITVRDISIGTGPAPRSHYGFKVRSSDGLISDVFVAEQKSIGDVVVVGDLMGRLTLERVRTDWEAFGPRCYLNASRGSAGFGKATEIHLREFGASRAPKDNGPYFRLTDPGGIRPAAGAARLVVEDSLGQAAPGVLVSRQGAWAAEGGVTVKGWLPEGVKVEADPVTPVPVPVPVP